MKQKSLIERYREVQQNKPQEPLGQMILRKQGVLGLKFVNAMIDCSIDISQKYRLTSSAIAMLHFLCRPQELERTVALPHLGDLDRWIEFEKPIDTPYEMPLHAICLAKMSSRAVFERALKQVPLSPGQRDVMEYNLFHQNSPYLPYKQSDTLWSYDVLDQDGRVFWKVAFRLTENATYEYLQAPDYRCPWNACEYLDGGLWNCQKCKDAFKFFISWLQTCQLMLSGAFTEHEEQLGNKEVSEYVTRQAQDKTKTWVQKDIRVEHRYKIVTFDACLRKTQPKPDVTSPRGSWVEAVKAIDPDMIVYVQKHITQTARTLRHERYVNKRGQTITIKPHDKRIPMKLSELKRKVTRVVASKYV